MAGIFEGGGEKERLKSEFYDNLNDIIIER